MIVSIWAVASRYNSRGWDLSVIDHEGQGYLLESYKKDEECILLKTLEINPPRENDLIELCDAHVGKMQEEVMEAQTRIAEYKAKFLTLGAPTAEELS
jgi:hypothetical protein